MLKENKPELNGNKIKYILLSIGAWLIGAYLFIFYSDRYDAIYARLSYFIILVALIFLANTLVDNTKIIKSRFSIRLACFILFVLSFGLLSELNGAYRQYEFNHNGIVTCATIVDFKQVIGLRGFSYPGAIIKYQCNQNYYHQVINNSIYHLQFNDNIKVLCSSNDPELIKIIGKKSITDTTYIAINK